jgi:serine/threonine protein kinase
MNNFTHLCPNCFADKQTAKQCPSCGYEETSAQQNPLYIKPRTILNQKYLIGNVIGHGGFGITYIGWDTVLEKKVAIKEFLPTTLATRISETNDGNTRYTVMHTSNQEDTFKIGLKKFKKEAKILAEFSHENIVRVIDYFEAYNTGYIVMEHAGQEDLYQLLKAEKRFSVEKALDIFLPILSALKVIHANGIYHQDISLQNIRMVDGKKPVLIDFGAARYIVGGLSQSLDKIFKPGYSPVEQITNDIKKIGPWTDIYACGAVFYNMIVGELPPSSIDRLTRDDLIPPAQKKGVEISSSVNNAVLKALSVRIGDRFQTVDEFETALKPRINGKKDKGPLLATLGLVSIVVAITVVVVVNYNQSSENSPPRDLEAPLIVVEDIQQTYHKGNNGFYNIRITDNNGLAAFSFSIKNTDIIYKSTTLDGKKEYEYNCSFSTDDWKTGQYTYILTGEDKAGNLTKKEGSFWVKVPESSPSIKKAECVLRLRICDDVEP